MTTKPQFQAIAVLSVESDLVRFTVLSSIDGHEVATATKRLTLITTLRNRASINRRSYDNDLGLPDEYEQTTNCSIPSSRQTPMDPGLVEQDPDKIWEAVEQVISEGIDKMCRDGTPVTYIKSIALTNEMGTLMSWDAVTGMALHNAIHWTDSRMVESDGISGGGRGGTASAVEWLLQRSTAASSMGSNCRFGTLDTWILWKLTGGQTYVTDITNASYTRLLNLNTLDWDFDACQTIGLTERTWPIVRPCSNDHSEAIIVTVGRLLGLSVNASMARPSAVLYGQGCVRRGQAILTLSDRTAVAVGAYERGPPSGTITRYGPLPVVGYCEPDYSGCTRSAKVMYGLMTMSTANAVVCWLKSNVALVSSAEECMNAYSSARAAGNQAYLVPALSGLPFAPYRRPEARLVVCGITQNMGRIHMITAAVDGMCYSAADMLKCIAAGASIRKVDTVYADGWYSEYGAVLEMVADISNSKVIKSRDDMAVHGVARMAATIINARYRDVYETLIYKPTISTEQREMCAKQWRKAVFRSYGWAAIDGVKSDDVFSQWQPPHSMATDLYLFVNHLFREITNKLITWSLGIYNDIERIHQNS